MQRLHAFAALVMCFIPGPAIGSRPSVEKKKSAALTFQRQPLIFFTNKAVSRSNLDVIWRAQKCNSEVWVITTGCNASNVERTWKCYDIALSAAHKIVDTLLLLHPGPPKKAPNSKAFEMASIVRWLYMMQLFKDERLSRAAFADLDVIVHSDLTAVAQSHPLLASAQVALTGRNGAVSVWTRRALASFTSFMMTLMANCSGAELSRHWSVDMGIIGGWLGVQTDAPVPPAILHPQTVIKLCGGSAIFPAPRQRLRVVNLNLASSWPVRQRFHAGGINDGAYCSPIGCPPMPVPNCTSGRPNRMSIASQLLQRFGHNASHHPSTTELPVPAFQRRTQTLRHSNPRFGNVRAASLWKVGTLCTPFTKDECDPESMLPFHAVHFTGRFKEYLSGGIRGIEGSGPAATCQCVRSSGPPRLRTRSPHQATPWRLGKGELKRRPALLRPRARQPLRQGRPL